jgi:hypothetical protein
MSFLDELLTLSPRGIRYFIAIMIVVTGCVCGAIINSTVGGTICAVLAVIGGVALIRMIVGDIGWTEKADSTHQAIRIDRVREDLPPRSELRRDAGREWRGDGS